MDLRRATLAFAMLALTIAAAVAQSPAASPSAATASPPSKPTTPSPTSSPPSNPPPPPPPVSPSPPQSLPLLPHHRPKPHPPPLPSPHRQPKPHPLPLPSLHRQPKPLRLRHLSLPADPRTGQLPSRPRPRCCHPNPVRRPRPSAEQDEAIEEEEGLYSISVSRRCSPQVSRRRPRCLLPWPRLPRRSQRHEWSDEDDGKCADLDAGRSDLGRCDDLIEMKIIVELLSCNLFWGFMIELVL
ncbi:vegetative cell wall protein gp1-like [Dioscorea cayenensis subsp. rotundata]|uniref:Vegetative cell wall protein gp1-like n=1 Tax=Dioscorea cayennensis subsp. rotundata TaxID=55577 RepID=A0AB40CBI9_DIOCR|nr:vegetative cell wall protein gp1-like [Dioscorea cayenensis subsp. rotundata]